MSKLKASSYEKYIIGIIFSVIPVVAFYLMEFYEHNPFVEVRSMAQLFNILIFEFIAWAVYVLTGHSKWALRAVLLVSMLYGLVNHYVMLFRTTPFVPWDVFSVGTALSVTSNYDFTPSMRVIIVTILFILLLFAMHFIDYKMKMHFLKRIIPGFILMLVLCVFVNMLQDDDFQTNNHLYPYLFTPAYMTQVNGMAVTFAMDLEYVVVDKPSGYHKESVKKIISEYKRADVADNMDELPNLIVVMDEAFSDLSILGDLDTNKDYMPFIHRLSAGAPNAISGNLNVSVCGGNTANTEFEFLTGNTMAFLPNGSIPYQQYVKGKTPSLAGYLKELGYQTYAQHPYYASGWNRDKVYDWFGFDELTFVNDYSSRRLIRKYVSDESSFDQIIRTFEKKQDGVPAFIFNVTMQNHGGYSDTYADFNNDITAELKNNSALDQYLTLISITDKQFERLVNYFTNVDEKTVIVFFGDHQPNDSVASAVAKSKENDYNRYQVPYVIWANFDMPSATGVDTSANYLAANIISAAGIPANDYYSYLIELEKDYPIISAVRTEKAATASDSSLDDYKKVQYYRLFDWEEE